MPATTRSHANQSHLDEFTAPSEDPKSSTKQLTKAQKSKKSTAKPSESPSKKRKGADATTSSPTKKQAKLTSSPPAEDTKPAHPDDGPAIQINRAPVLDLWASVVTRFLYPDLDWKTCLSAGSAISNLCAISKGKAIGTIDTGNDGEKREHDREKKKKKEGDLDEIDVMGFKLKVKDGLVLVSGKPKAENEAAQKKKFGDEAYERAKRVMEECLQTWKGAEEDLSGKAFKMYEKFRPNVASGQQGWGRKGELEMDRIREAVTK
ncbi:hypothetical protein MBLNU457_4072t1 [Dothideomycetes sp. NU457]